MSPRVLVRLLFTDGFRQLDDLWYEAGRMWSVPFWANVPRGEQYAVAVEAQRLAEDSTAAVNRLLEAFCPALGVP